MKLQTRQMETICTYIYLRPMLDSHMELKKLRYHPQIYDTHFVYMKRARTLQDITFQEVVFIKNKLNQPSRGF